METSPVADAPPSAAPTAGPGTDPTGCPVDHLPAAEPVAVDAPACPVDHRALAAAPAETAPGGAPPVDLTAAEPEPSACPVDHRALAAAAAGPEAGCPVIHGPGGIRRTKADLVVRRLLRIPERPAGVTAASAYSAFQKSMLISAVRCTLTYVVFPFVLPAARFATSVGPAIGVLIGSFALVCDTFTIRRFFAVDHKWRWQFSAIAFSIMCLLGVLLVQDLIALLT
jgi:hypothetical protein